MVQKFLAEAIAHSEQNKGSLNLDVTFVDEAGASQALSLTPAVVAELAAILKGYGKNERFGELTRMPQSYAVGHGRYEPLVLLRFEDEAAYALSPKMAMGLCEALAEEVADLREMRYLARQ